MRIAPHNGGAKAELLHGQSARFDNEQVYAPGKVRLKDHAWQRGVLVADNMPLSEFLDQLSRYRSGYVRYDAAVAEINIVGTFPLVDTDQIFVALQKTLPVQVTHATPWWVTVRKR